MIKYTPPLGWNTWNTFAENINEELILETADKLVETGLRDAGYDYLVIDDIWALKNRDENNRLVPNPEKFPHGMKYVADYIHSKGLKFGMYSCSGFLTCGGYPGSYGYEWIDAQTFASWDVDFLKYDFCFNPSSVSTDILYKRMGLALSNCGRDILFSACNWGCNNSRRWMKETSATMWRSTGDIFDSWESIKKLAQSQLKYIEYNSIGCFNDMDMLVVGMNGGGNVGLTGCSFEEYRLHFSLWALMNSPLMIGCDIRDMSAETKTILLNKEVIAINQDKGGRSPFYVNTWRYEVNNNRKADEPYYLNYPINTPALAKYLDNGDIAIGLLNFTDSDAKFAVGFDALGIPVESGKTLELQNLWTGEVSYAENGMVICKKCGPHDSRMYRAKVVDKK